MRLLRANSDQFVFRLSKREQQMLLEILELYPLVPPAHHRLASPGQLADDSDAQRLLDEALAEHRRENRTQVLALLNDPERMQETGRGLELKLTAAQMEWLLQVLNDVRVGSWLALGEPEPDQPPRLDKVNATCWVAMEACGIWESVLLSALGAEQSPEWL